MKKEEIFVRIDSEEKRLRAIQILTDAGEYIWSESSIFDIGATGNLHFSPHHEEWIYVLNTENLTEITLDQLEQILAVQDVHLTIDEIRLQAKKLGFELVEKKREVKIGDFGVFWDYENFEKLYFSFVRSVKDGWFLDERGLSWENFRHLTDEEKQKIQENW